MDTTEEKSKKLGGRIDELSLKVAFVVTAIIATLNGFVYFTGFPISMELWLILSIPAIGLATYFVTNYFISTRIEDAHSMLRRFRKRNFEGVSSFKPPHGDALDELFRQVYRIGYTMQNEIDRLKKLENYRREFLGDVSHELKTPIFAIQGFAETLLDGALEDEEVNQVFLEKIVRNSERLNNLVNDLSAISMIETGQLKMQPEPFDVGVFLQEILDHVEHLLEKNEVLASLNVQQNLPMMVADRDRMRQVMANLVENAIKYNHIGGKVEVGANLNLNGEIRISVTDNGPGIAPEEIDRVTERFYRVDKSRSREQGGTGLGLAIVKHILEAHQSKLYIDSVLGKGSTFAFSLPSEHLVVVIPDRSRSKN